MIMKTMPSRSGGPSATASPKIPTPITSTSARNGRALLKQERQRHRHDDQGVQPARPLDVPERGQLDLRERDEAGHEQAVQGAPVAFAQGGSPLAHAQEPHRAASSSTGSHAWTRWRSPFDASACTRPP